MPIVKTFNIDTKTRLYLWEVRETLAVLQEQVKLTPEQTETFGKIHNERAQKNFLATRFKRWDILLRCCFMTLMGGLI